MNLLLQLLLMVLIRRLHALDFVHDNLILKRVIAIQHERQTMLEVQREANKLSFFCTASKRAQEKGHEGKYFIYLVINSENYLFGLSHYLSISH